jgi:predicted ATP-grasp superfamily ATP-dependent carboligase
MNWRASIRQPPVAVFDNYWATTLAFARSLGRRGVPLHFYGSGAGRWSRFRTMHWDCPLVENTREFLPWLRNKIRSGEISRIAPTTDLVAYYVSVLRDEFAPAVQRTIAPLKEIEQCLIKTRFASAIAASGEPTLATSAPDSLERAVIAAGTLGYPLMLKPKSHLAVGFGERGQLLQDDADLERHYGRYKVCSGQESIAAAYPELGWPLLQRYLPSARRCVYSVSGFKDADAGVVIAAVSYKREQWPPDVGVSTVQIAHESPRILQAGLRVVDKLLSRGIFEVELVEDGDVLYAIDLNPRAFGFLELDIARGADLPWLWYRSTIEVQQPLTETLPPIALEARDRFRHVLNALTRWGRRASAEFRERRDPNQSRSSVSMVGHWSDPLPMILCNLELLRHPRSLLRSQVAFLAARGLDRP